MTPFETIYTHEMVVACDGGPLGHPRVYLNLAPAGKVECPYCSRLFVNQAMAESPAPTATDHAARVATPSAQDPGAARGNESPSQRQSMPEPG
jgi:uncharacterized Zn-finger protein